MGCLAYELLVGGPPFEAQTRAETFRRIVETEPFIPQHLSDAAKSFLKQVQNFNPPLAAESMAQMYAATADNWPIDTNAIHNCNAHLCEDTALLTFMLFIWCTSRTSPFPATMLYDSPSSLYKQADCIGWRVPVHRH